MNKVKSLNIVILFLLAASPLIVSGCAMGAYHLVGASAGLVLGTAGTGMYNAAQDEKDMEKVGGSTPAPSSICFANNMNSVKNTIIETLVESGETVEVATDNFIKTAEKREAGKAGAISGWAGRSVITSTKSITLSQEKGLTKVTVGVDIFKDTMYTDKSKEEWPEVESRIRGKFFDLLSKKLKPVTS